MARGGVVGRQEKHRMLNWGLIFILVALAAAIFGFTGVALAAAGIAKVVFFLFLIFFLLSLVTALGRRA
jgi:uncharacterized membrane protein YtjA (UPF0391 family)